VRKIKIKKVKKKEKYQSNANPEALTALAMHAKIKLGTNAAQKQPIASNH
jgi:hypothetical protein